MFNLVARMTHEVALEKMKAYCAYQERCQQEVRQKLAKLGVYYDDADLVIIDLITQNFLDEVRYAQAYASGKFNIKKWGRNKIKQNLKMKGISQKCIEIGLKEINEEDYFNTLDQLVLKLQDKYSDLDEFKRKGKIAQFLSQKGYEKELIWNILTP